MSATTPTSTAVGPDRFPWPPILVLGFAWFLAVAIELSPAGLLNDIAGDLDVSIAAVGTMTTFYALGNAVLVLPLTSLAIRFPARTALTVVMIVFVASNVGVALAPGIVLADVGRFIGGAAYGIICTLFPAVVVRTAGPRFAARGITVVFTATSLGAAFGAPLASILGNALGWRVTFLVAAGLSLIAGVLMTFTVPRVRDTAHRSLTLLETARLPGVLRVAVAWSLVMLAHFVVLTYIEAYLEELGAPASTTSVALFIIGAGGIVGTLLIGRISRRSNFAALIAGPALVAVGFGVVLAGRGSLAAVLVGIALWGIGIAATVVIYQQMLLLTGARAPESATSIGVLLAQGGFAAGASIGGLTIGLAGVGAVPAVALAFVAASIVLATTLRSSVSQPALVAPHEA